MGMIFYAIHHLRYMEIYDLDKILILMTSLKITNYVKISLKILYIFLLLTQHLFLHTDNDLLHHTKIYILHILYTL